MTDNARTPADVLCDALVYAPLGFAFEARKLLPQLAQRGRSQVATARYLGEFVAHKAGAQLGSDLEKASRDVGQALGGLVQRVGMALPTLLNGGGAKADPAAAPAAEETVVSEPVDVVSPPADVVSTPVDTVVSPPVADVVSSPVADVVSPSSPVGDLQVEDLDVDLGVADPVPAPLVGELAIPGYDSLAASQVVPRLTSLDLGELTAVRDYEASNRGRRTILNRVEQLLTQRRSTDG